MGGREKNWKDARGKSVDGSGASERGAGGPQEEQLLRRRSPRGGPRLPAPPRPTPVPAPEADGHWAARADAAGASGDGGAARRGAF